MNHKEAGIKRRVSVPVYAKDILSELTLIMSPLDIKGAWVWCLLSMWDTGADRVTGTFEEMGFFWGCSDVEAKRISEEIKRRKIGDVTFSHNDVTIVSRRLSRAKKHREQDAKRKRKQRKKESHAPVTAKKALPSSSSSISSSSSSSISTKVKDKERSDKSPLPQVASDIATALFESIRSWKYDFKKPSPSAFRNWVLDIDKAMRIDKRSESKLKEIIEWLPSHTSNSDFTWRANVLSGKKLREQYDKLDTAMITTKPEVFKSKFK